MAQSEDNVLGTGLNLADWRALRDQVVPLFSSRDGKLIPPHETDARLRHLGIAPSLPEHLTNHPIARLVRKYRATGEHKYLDRAGQALVPGNKLWFLVLTK